MGEQRGVARLAQPVIALHQMDLAHPVKDLDTGRVSITSQNHGFAVDGDNLPANLRVTHQSLFDGTLQGIARTDQPAFSFQGHPEASCGPHDIDYLFDRFIQLMREAKA